jgi:hypothetical protein
MKRVRVSDVEGMMRVVAVVVVIEVRPWRLPLHIFGSGALAAGCCGKG